MEKAQKLKFNVGDYVKQKNKSYVKFLDEAVYKIEGFESGGKRDSDLLQAILTPVSFVGYSITYPVMYLEHNFDSLGSAIGVEVLYGAKLPEGKNDTN